MMKGLATLRLGFKPMGPASKGMEKQRFLITTCPNPMRHYCPFDWVGGNILTHHLFEIAPVEAVLRIVLP